MASGQHQRGHMNGVSDELLAGASERLLKQITQLYDSGLGGGPGAMGLKAIAEHPLVGLQIRKPRRKLSVMLIGNHSAGKSSFINWYIGEQVLKTGVAIETRGFIFVTSGRKRETLTGDATLRYYDHLEAFGDHEGILPNLFTEISTSRERSFTCVDFIDTPGLVDGDMQYPFDVQDTIVWMADHVDLILVFFDPIGQATCKRTMQVVERLNHGPHVEKIQYFMSKADEVDKESDRQRVLIQITQNLATRIRNSHAFNLPTFFLPHDDDLPCSIPNAIEDVCGEIDKAINQTVQKTLRSLKAHCATILKRIDERIAQDAANKAINRRRTTHSLMLGAGSLLAAILLLLLLAVRLASLLCAGHAHSHTAIYSAGAAHGEAHSSSSSSSSGGSGSGLCSASAVQTLVAWSGRLGGSFGGLAGCAAAAWVVLGVAAWVSWRALPALTKRDLRRLEEFRGYVQLVAKQESALYEEYFATLANNVRER